jgi:hypothetical protein
VASSLSDRLRDTTDPQFAADWERQRRTAADILQRLQGQEGVILADQVGMGKTYVALAVAVSEILATRDLGQVVIFVPPAVADKWVREWKKFSETLVTPGSGVRCVEHPIRRGEDFLKALDDPPSRRNHLVVVTHTALTSNLNDDFVQLALLHYATRNMHGAAELRKRISKWSDGRRGLIPTARFTPHRVATLLETPPVKWHETWLKLTGDDLPDDPVAKALEGAARNAHFGELRAVINALPIRTSANIKENLRSARKDRSEKMQVVWTKLLSSTHLDLPLLIVDEAHRLKNSETQISKLTFTIEVHPDRDIDRPVRHRSVPDLDHDRVNEHHRVNAVEWPGLPRHHVIDDPVGDLRDRLPAHLRVIDLQQMLLDVAGCHALGIQRNDVRGEAVELPLMLRDRDRVEAAVAISRDRQVDRTDLGRDRFR